jgi:hypothetical protein
MVDCIVISSVTGTFVRDIFDMIRKQQKYIENV